MSTAFAMRRWRAPRVLKPGETVVFNDDGTEEIINKDTSEEVQQVPTTQD